MAKRKKEETTFLTIPEWARSKEVDKMISDNVQRILSNRKLILGQVNAGEAVENGGFADIDTFKKAILSVFTDNTAGYSIQRISKFCSLFDEDETFVDEYELPFEVGTAEGIKSHVMRIMYKVRNPESSHPYSHMPFDIVKTWVVPE